MKKKQILFVYDTVYPFSKGGGEYRTYELAKNLTKRGWQVTWFCRKYWDNNQNSIYLDGIKLQAVCNFQKDVKNTKGIRRTPFKTLPFIFGIFKQQIPKSTQIIFTPQTPFLHCFPIFIKSKINKIPVIIDCWEIWGKEWFKHFPFYLALGGYLIEKIVYRLADHLTPISYTGIRKLKASNFKNNKITHLENGVELQKIKKTKPSAILSDIVYFGRLVKYKNIDVIVKSLPIIVKKIPKLKFIIIGNGIELDYLRNLANKLKVLENIEFYTNLNHSSAISIIKSSKIFLQLSTSEGGASIAVNESHACGLPVIAVNHEHGIDKELIEHNKTGIWLNDLNPKKLSTVILNLFTNEKYKSMHRYLIEPKDCIEWSYVAEKLEKIIIKLLITSNK